MSGLNDYFVRILDGCLLGGLFPYLYCDGIFPNRGGGRRPWRVRDDGQQVSAAKGG